MAKILKHIEAGDIVRVQLNPTIGHEKQKERFCLVVEAGSSHLNLLVVLPITEDNGKRHGGLFVSITNLDHAGLSKPSVIDCYQIRAISTLRLQRYNEKIAIGRVGDEVLFEVRRRLASLLDIGEEHVV